VTGLLGWREMRPVAPAGLATRLLAMLESGLAPLRQPLEDLLATRGGGTLMISKTMLERLACDGWQLEPEPYAHTAANVRGTLAHEAIAFDWERRRSEPVEVVVERTWFDAASRRPGDPASLSAWLNACPAEEAERLRAEVGHLLATFREVWPVLPERAVEVRIEEPIVIRLAGGLVTLRGRPDMVFDSPRADDRARALVVDLKTGRPRSEHDRHELRFYGLLVTLATGKPPFRWSTYYVTEGRAESEDLREETLEVTARRVLDGVRQAIRLAPHRSGAASDEDDLTITGGAWCRYCLRRASCPAAPERLEVSHPGGIVQP
jgi:hypothetical protein